MMWALILVGVIVLGWFILRAIQISQLPSTLGTTNFDDPEIIQAIANARAMLNYFWDKKASALNPEDFFVKVRVEDSDGGVEHIWVANPILEGDQVRGEVNSDTVVIKTHRLGDTITYPVSEITDWMYNEGGKMHGNYTARVTAKPHNMSRAQYEQLVEMFAPLPEADLDSNSLTNGA